MKQDVSNDRTTGEQRPSPTVSTHSGGGSGTGLNCETETKVSESVSLKLQSVMFVTLALNKQNCMRLVRILLLELLLSVYV